MEVVTIGSRLPYGYVIEAGLTTTAKLANGSRTARVQRQNNYARFTIRGTNETAIIRTDGVAHRLPSRLAPEPYINRDVPKDLWDQWKKEHAQLPVLKNGRIFEVPNKDSASAAAVVMDAKARPGILVPVDPSKPVTLGPGGVVEKAKFNE